MKIFKQHRSPDMYPALANREVLERIANGFDNYDEENYEDFNGKSSNKVPGIYTITLVNSAVAARDFFLYHGQFPYYMSHRVLTIPALTVSGGLTVAQDVELAKDGVIKDGAFSAIGAVSGLTATGSPSNMNTLLAYLHANPGQKLTGMSIYSTNVANHTGSIQYGTVNPFKSDADWKAPIDISSFRSPKDYDQNITIVRCDLDLNRNCAVKMTVAASSTVVLKLYMNGSAAA